MSFDSFDEVQEHLDRLGLFHMDFGPGRMRRALEALDLLQPQSVAVQVVGTNGKGSTSTFLAALGRSHGLKVGLHTSPHFLSPRERIRVNGAMLSPVVWTELASQVHDAAPDLTYFEFLTALCLLAFEREQVDLAILETGLGGRYDATTAAVAHLVCYTPIGMDHEKVLGDSLAAIAGDKAGAIRPAAGDFPGSPVFTGAQEAEVRAILARAAHEAGVPFFDVSASPLPFGLFASPETVPPLGLSGPHQWGNARLALAVWEYLSQNLPGHRRPWPLQRAAVLEALASAWLPGRMQRAPAAPGHPDLLLDGAHNPHAFRALKQALESEGLQPRALIFSCLADKNIEAMRSLVLDIAQGVPIFTPTIQENERAMDGEELARRLGPTARPFQRVQLALESALALSPAADVRHPVLVCGSLYLLGDFFTLYPHLLEGRV